MSAYEEFDDEDYSDWDDIPDYLSLRKQLAPRDEHVMNKDEAKLMRRLKNQTGLSEEEIRSKKKYRIMLSNAQKEGQKPKRTKLEKARDRVFKFVCRDLELPKEHPDVRRKFLEEWMILREKNKHRTSSIYNEMPNY